MKRAVWRVVRRFTRPELAAQLLQLLGMEKGDGVQQQANAAMGGSTLQLAPAAPSEEEGGDGGALPVAQLRRQQQQQGQQQQQQQGQEEQQQQVVEGRGEGEEGEPVGAAELDEAAFQLVRELLAVPAYLRGVVCRALGGGERALGLGGRELPGCQPDGG